MAEYREVIAREYDALFSEFGLNAVVTAKVKNHLAAIEHARTEAEAYLIQLDEAKLAYDEQMKQLLGPEQYHAYRERESGRPAIRELASLKEYLMQSEGLALTPPEEASLFGALKKSKRIPVYDGPYGQGAHAGAGREKVLASMAEEMSLLQAEQADLLKILSEAGASEVLWSKINDYYLELERRKQEGIDRLMSALQGSQAD